MTQKTKWSAYLLIGAGILFGLSALGLMGLSVLGVFAALAEAFTSSETIVLVIMTLFGLVGLWAVTAVHLIAGMGLLRGKSWARKLAMVLAAFHLFNVPVGTLLGGFILYTFINDKESIHMFKKA